MTYYIFIEKYDGTKIKFFTQHAKERDVVLRNHIIGIKFKAWVTGNGRKYKICDIANLDRLFICPFRNCDIYDIIYELRDLSINLPIRLDDKAMKLYYPDIIKLSKEAEKFLLQFNSFRKSLEQQAV